MMSDSIDNQDKLIESAKQAALSAHAPYSGFSVGAALLSEDGSISIGCNVECSSYGATICAERSALAAAIVAGKRKFGAIAIYTDTDFPTAPCGICRQTLIDFSPDLTVISACRNHKTEIHKLSELLPSAFGNRNLLRK